LRIILIKAGYVQLAKRLLEFIFGKSRPVPPDTEQLCRLIDYRFSNTDLLLKALKHRSFLVVSGEDRLQSNERLELLGDSVLGLVVTEYLYLKFPEAEEGVLTNYKSLLVNRANLARVANKFDLGDFLLMNEAEEKAGGRTRVSILSDALEALLGAAYLDGGLSAVAKIIQEHIAEGLEDLLAEGTMQNHKSLLLEHCQRENLNGPSYVIESEQGPDHNKLFTVAVVVNGERYGLGSGRSKKFAEQMAAKEALIRLKIV
jgi:ribonuclease III